MLVGSCEDGAGIVFREREYCSVKVTPAEIGVFCAFLVGGGLPVLRCGGYRAVVVYAGGEKIWRALLRFGGLYGKHPEGRLGIDCRCEALGMSMSECLDWLSGGD